MTSIASTSPAPPAATSNSTNASTPSTKAHAQSPSVSGQTTPSAAVPASAPASRQASLSYANVVNSKKTPTGPGASSGIAASQVSGGVSGQHARSVSTTSVPVNGKIQPAVPQIGNSGNSVANGTTPYSGGQHSRKTSLASGAMPNGASRGAPNIKFGNINEPGSGPQPSGTAVAAGNNLTAPLAPNPRASSPSPSNAVQPVASGGAPPSAGTARPIQFGDTTPHQRPLSLPSQPHPPQGPNSMGPQGHTRRDSTQSAHGESGPTMSHGRGMPPAGRGGRHQTYGQNQFQPSQPYGYGRGYQGGGNQQRNGPANMGAPVPYTQQYPNSPHRVPRSPALSQASTHASPSLSTAVPSTPQLFPPAHGQGGYLPGSPHVRVASRPCFVFSV
jgi:translation initiation factor 4G